MTTIHVERLELDDELRAEVEPAIEAVDPEIGAIVARFVDELLTLSDATKTNPRIVVTWALAKGLVALEDAAQDDSGTAFAWLGLMRNLAREWERDPSKLMISTPVGEQGEPS